MSIDPYRVTKNPSRLGDHVEKSFKVDVQVDPMAAIFEMVEHKYQFRAEEQGIFHPLLHHGLKLRNNGAAELFTGDDTGIRVDRNSQSINNFANHYKNHIHHMTSWLTGSANFFIDEHWSVKTKGKHIVVSGDTIEITGAKDMNVNIKGNVNAKVSGHATIETERDLNLRSKHLAIEADTYQTPWGAKD